MVGSMAIFHENEKNDRKAVYDAAEKWKSNCLLDNRSLIWEGESIWTDSNIDRFRTILSNGPMNQGIPSMIN